MRKSCQHNRVSNHVFLLVYFQDICKLGEVLLMSHLRIECGVGGGVEEPGEKRERLFLLFPGVLVMLSVSHSVSGYMYEVGGLCQSVCQPLRQRLHV